MWKRARRQRSHFNYEMNHYIIWLRYFEMLSNIMEIMVLIVTNKRREMKHAHTKRHHVILFPSFHLLEFKHLTHNISLLHRTRDADAMIIHHRQQTWNDYETENGKTGRKYCFNWNRTRTNRKRTKIIACKAVRQTTNEHARIMSIYLIKEIDQA